ncbi:hypothetical protein [Marichromatium gracile]|nr:hypothetical protein [Marichromatium gracile]
MSEQYQGGVVSPEASTAEFTWTLSMTVDERDMLIQSGLMTGSERFKPVNGLPRLLRIQLMPEAVPPVTAALQAHRRHVYDNRRRTMPN